MCFRFVRSSLCPWDGLSPPLLQPKQTCWCVTCRCRTSLYVCGCACLLACPWERVHVCMCFLRMWIISPHYWWARPLPHSPWPSSRVLTPPVLIMPGANTCCKGSEEVETGWEKEYIVCPCASCKQNHLFLIFFLVHREISDILCLMLTCL